MKEETKKKPGDRTRVAQYERISGEFYRKNAAIEIAAGGA